MTDERPKSQKPDTEEERLKRPEDAAKDLEPAPDEAEAVKGGITSRKAGGKQEEY